MSSSHTTPTSALTAPRRTAGRSRGSVGAGVLALLALVACGGGAPPDPAGPGATRPLTVAEALRSPPGEQVRVSGAVVVSGNEARICDGLAESHPPQCPGGARLLRFRASDLPPGRSSARGVSWASPVELVVAVEDGALRYLSTPKAR